MSFFSNFQSDKCPGAISGNPLNGLCEKVCIQAQKIFDACIKQIQLENYTLTLTDLTPADPTYPLTFISAKSITSAGSIWIRICSSVILAKEIFVPVRGSSLDSVSFLLIFLILSSRV